MRITRGWPPWSSSGLCSRTGNFQNRHQTGKKFNDHLGMPDKRLPHGGQVVKMAAAQMKISPSETLSAAMAGLPLRGHCGVAGGLSRMHGLDDFQGCPALDQGIEGLRSENIGSGTSLLPYRCAGEVADRPSREDPTGA